MAESGTDERDLEELLNKATDLSSDLADELAVHMFCMTVRNNPQLIKKATELIVSKIKSTSVTQSRKALELLEECMSKCGSDFQTNIARFQFLNELIRLVSKKFSGDDTPAEIRNKILDSLSLWSVQYPERTKIKEAYDTLLRSGVQHEVNTVTPATNCKRSSLVDNENEKLLKRLLSSKNREDHQRANLLIQYLVKQDAKKNELTSRQRLELQEARNSVTVLNEFLDRWDADQKISDEELAKEIFTMCDKSKVLVMKMPGIIEDNEKLLADAIEVNHLLLEATERYKNYNKAVKPKMEQSDPVDLMPDLELISSPASKQTANPLDELSELFKQSLQTPVMMQSSIDLLQPMSAKTEKEAKAEAEKKLNSTEDTEKVAKSLLPTIDQLSDDLFKQNLNAPIRLETFKSKPNKIPIKDLVEEKKKQKACDNNLANASNISQAVVSSERKTFPDFLVDAEEKDSDVSQIANCFLSGISVSADLKKGTDNEQDLTSLLDELLLTNSSSPLVKNEPNLLIQTAENVLLPDDEDIVKIGDDIDVSKKPAQSVKHLSEIEVELNTIQPSKERPRIVMDDVQGLRVTLNFAQDRPSSYVNVIVISTINQSSSLISDYQIDASVPKPCKLRLLPPTGNALPGTKPFHVPTESIQQILLLSNPTEKPVAITCIIGYRLGNDPDPTKESVIVDNVPYIV